jgi:predicted phosphoribosyltransferase
MFNINDAVEIANKLNIKLDKFSIKDLLTGINIELEHGKINPKTNITNDDLEMTTKIALAHLNEYPNYYNEEYGIPFFEKTLKEKLSQK